MKKLFITCVLLVLCCIGNSSVVLAGVNPKPFVIPELKEWRGGEGFLPLTTEARITYPKGQTDLQRIARMLVADCQELLGYTPQVVEGKARKGDLHLSLKKDKELGSEGYEIRITDRIELSAPQAIGVYWGTRTLLQIAEQNREDLALPKGVIRDCPDYAMRGFMMDCGRKFIPLHYLQDLVKIMAYYKMNVLQLHLNDNGFKQYFENDWNKTYAAFRLESDTYPGLTARDGHYTKQEFVDLQILAENHFVEIIPEIDAPAHTLAFSHYKPELGSKEYGMDHLDLFNPETYTFMDGLFKEYLEGEQPVFRGPRVHIGTDEYNKKEAEQYRYFTDRYLKYVEKYGKTPRMWGGLKWLPGKTPVKAEGVTVNAWSFDWVDPEVSLQDGYKLINSCDTYLYIVPAAGYYRDFLDHKWLYESWSPWMMNRKLTLPEGTPGVLGAMFAVWNDKCGNGISEQDVHLRSFPAIQVLAEKLWKGRNEKVPFEAFEVLCKQLPEAPGVNLLARVPAETQLTPAGEVCTFRGQDVRTTVLEEVGYPYEVAFQIRPDKDCSNSCILFKGPHSVFYANWENTGRLAFSRDGYTFVFQSYRLPEEQWTDIRIQGDYKGTSLYVNGELKERLEGRTMKVYRAQYKRMEYMQYQETLIFPLKQVGDAINGFTGQLKNVVCKPLPKP